MPEFQNSVNRVASRYASQQRQAAMRRMALRQRTLLYLMNQKGRFGIVSAYTTGPKSKNQKRHGQLMADLQKMGYHKITTLKGQWDGISEKSVLIQNIRPAHLFTLGVKFGQDATIYKSAQGVVGMYYPAGEAEIAVDQSSLSPAMEIADGGGLFSKTQNWSFSLGFLWGHRIPWDGRTPITPAQVESLVKSLK